MAHINILDLRQLSEKQQVIIMDLQTGQRESKSKRKKTINFYVLCLLLFLILMNLVILGACNKKTPPTTPSATIDNKINTSPPTIDQKKNAPPTAPGISINPNPVVGNKELTAIIMSGSVDPDRDKITYSYQWYKDNVIQPLLTTSTIPADNVIKNQTWRVEVTPSDGKENGLSSSAEITVKNSPPTSPVVKYSPDTPISSKDLRVLIEQNSIDPDGDTITYIYQWCKDNVTQTSLIKDVVPANNLAKGQSWRCLVVPTDGENDGIAAEVEMIIAADYKSSDYFPTTEGIGIKYHITDDYKHLICNVWAIFQHCEAIPRYPTDFFVTLTKEGTDGGYWSNSDMAGYYSKNFSGQDVTMFGTADVGNQANFYGYFTLPPFFSSGDHWTTPLGEYSVEDLGSQSINGTEFNNCVRVEIDTSNDTNSYLRGSGFYIVAEGVGIVKLEFVRVSGEKCLYEYVESKKLARHNISGKIVVSQALIALYGMPVVQISTSSWGNRSTVNSDGSFSLQVYGPDILLWVGFDKDGNYQLDLTNYPKYPKEYLVNNITSDVGGLLYVLD